MARRWCKWALGHFTVATVTRETSSFSRPVDEHSFISAEHRMWMCFCNVLKPWLKTDEIGKKLGSRLQGILKERELFNILLSVIFTKKTTCKKRQIMRPEWWFGKRNEMQCLVQWDTVDEQLTKQNTKLNYGWIQIHGITYLSFGTNSNVLIFTM